MNSHSHGYEHARQPGAAHASSSTIRLGALQSARRRTALLHFSALVCITLIALLTGFAAYAQAPGGRITAHVLDVYTGTPANGIKVELFKDEGSGFALVKANFTTADGRPSEGPMVAPGTLKTGKYRMVVHTGDYYKKIAAKVPSGYYTRLTIDFDVYDATQPHHIPFQITPWTQSTSVLPG